MLRLACLLFTLWHTVLFDASIAMRHPKAYNSDCRIAMMNVIEPNSCARSPEGFFECCDCLWQEDLWHNAMENAVIYKRYEADPDAFFMDRDHIPPQPLTISRAEFRAPMEAYQVQIARVSMEYYVVEFRCRLTPKYDEMERILPSALRRRSPYKFAMASVTPLYRVHCPIDWDWDWTIVQSAVEYNEPRAKDRMPKPSRGPPEAIIKARCAPRTFDEHGNLDRRDDIGERVTMNSFEPDSDEDSRPNDDEHNRSPKRRRREEKSVILQDQDINTYDPTCISLPQHSIHKIDEPVMIEAGLRSTEALNALSAAAHNIQLPIDHNQATIASEEPFGEEALQILVQSDPDYAGMMQLLATSPDRQNFQLPHIVHSSVTDQLSYMPTTADWPSWPEAAHETQWHACLKSPVYIPEAAPSEFYLAITQYLNDE